VIECQFGNFVLQKSLKEFSKCMSTKIKLIKATIAQLDLVTDANIKVKWARSILKDVILLVKPDEVQQELAQQLSEASSELG